MLNFDPWAWFHLRAQEPELGYAANEISKLSPQDAKQLLMKRKSEFQPHMLVDTSDQIWSKSIQRFLRNRTC